MSNNSKCIISKTIKIIIVIIGSLFLFIGIPLLINHLYNMDYVLIYTAWGATEVLSFYGSVLAFLGTVSLGFVTVKLSKQANDINQRMLNFEYSKSKPCIIPTTGLYDLYSGEDICKNTNRYKNDKRSAILISPLFITTPHSGITTSIAAIAVDFTNTGKSDIISIIINKIEICLSVSYDLVPAKSAIIIGNTNIKVNEKKKLFFEFKQEFFEDKKDLIVNVDKNDADVLPNIYMELELLTQEGINYKERLHLETSIHRNQNNNKNCWLRSFNITEIKVEMEDTHNANT